MKGFCVRIRCAAVYSYYRSYRWMLDLLGCCKTQNPSLTRLIISYFLKKVLNWKIARYIRGVYIFMFLALSNVPFFKTFMMNVILDQIYRSGVMLQRSDLSGVSIAFNRDRKKRQKRANCNNRNFDRSIPTVTTTINQTTFIMKFSVIVCSILATSVAAFAPSTNEVRKSFARCYFENAIKYR